MSYYVYADISCTNADQGRLKAAVALIEATNKGQEPVHLPPVLEGYVKDIADFKERFADHGDLAYLEYDESPESVFIGEDDIDIDGLAQLFRTCLVDSLPMSLSWTFEGGIGGASAIFADRVYRATTIDLEHLLLEQGAREAMAAAT